MQTKTKTKTDADRKLIKEVFAIDPVSWARYPDGLLVFISPTGQKFGYTQEQFDNIKDAVKIEKAAKKKLSRKKKKPEPPVDFNTEVDSAKGWLKDKSAGAAG